MVMNERPQVKCFEDGSKIWSKDFGAFTAKVYVPATELPEKVINFGFEAPYLMLFEETARNEAMAKAYADENGFAKLASDHASSVVFISIKDNDWENVDETVFTEVIANSKIHQYHQDGYAILNNRFTNSCDGYAIRGAIFRTYLYGVGKSADYIATKLLKTINGEGLWGPADVTPVAAVLENLNVMPSIERKDIPIVSVGNSADINKYISENIDESVILESIDYEKNYYEFLKKYKRWVGDLKLNPDFDKLNMMHEPTVVTLNTSSDNEGDDKGTTTHEVGYIAYYNKDVFANGPAPLLLCFHGGGDSAMYITHVSEWYRVAHDHNFLLVCIEDHLNSTATEMMELLEHLYKKYDIDNTRIYASGFSMGGCKSWDLYQEYPEVFAGLAPMDATFDVGLNVFGSKAPKEINKDVLVPVFYAAGEITPLPELPFQEKKCTDRMAYTLKLNKVVKKYDVDFDNQAAWENKLWGINGDRTEQYYDPEREGTLTMHYFDSEDGNCYTAFGGVDNQGHECRYFTCNQAWMFISKFRRVDGKIMIEK